MKKITLWLMKRNLKNAIKKQEKVDSSIVKRAYDDLIKSYKTTIMFLESEINSKKKK